MPTPECLQAQLDAEIERRTDLEKRVRDLERVRAEVDGAVWAFARIGAATVAVLGILGAIVVNGVPEGVKRLLR